MAGKRFQVERACAEAVLWVAFDFANYGIGDLQGHV